MEKRPYLSNHSYKVLKQLFQIDLPVLGSLYFLLSAVLDLPAVTIVLGVIILLVTFVGFVLKASLRRYNQFRAIGESGQMVISTESNGKKTYSLELDIDPDDIEDLTELMFRVKKVVPRT